MTEVICSCSHAIEYFLAAFMYAMLSSSAQKPSPLEPDIVN